jgi:hypothetical protein
LVVPTFGVKSTSNTASLVAAEIISNLSLAIFIFSSFLESER